MAVAYVNQSQPAHLLERNPHVHVQVVAVTAEARVIVDNHVENEVAWARIRVLVPSFGDHLHANGSPR